MQQIKIFRGLPFTNIQNPNDISAEVVANKWLAENKDKKIIDIKITGYHVQGQLAYVCVLIHYEDPSPAD